MDNIDNIENRFGFLHGGERAAYLLRGLYEAHGYKKYRMGKFEEYDFYTGYKDFLPSGQILTFTDLNGKLMALKPDVTMSIIKRTRAAPGNPERLYYNESIYRPARGSREFKEIEQIGVEYIGGVGADVSLEIISLALESLALINADFILDVSHNGFLSGLLESAALPPEAGRDLARLLEQKNAHEIGCLLDKYEAGSEIKDRLQRLLSITGDFGEGLREAGDLVTNVKMDAALTELNVLYAAFAGSPAAGALRLDFSSFAGNASYYNGLVMRGYTYGAARPVLSGGRYDPLLRRLGVRELEAIGFAVYLDEIDAGVRTPRTAVYDIAGSSANDTASGTECADHLTIALPKGRMGNMAYELFTAAGYGCDGYSEDSRKLVINNDAAGVSFLLVKPQDVAVYVERGAADLGIAGKDTLLETSPDIYELLDLRFGKCRLAVAAPDAYEDDPDAVLRVATKYPNVTRDYFTRQNREIEVIKLNGSIELAPVLGISDVIADIVETGTTLKENNLSVRELIADSSARLIANIISYKFKLPEISSLLEKIITRLSN